MTLKFGDVCPGWTPRAWAAELRRKADACRGQGTITWPESWPSSMMLEAYYEKWAEIVERRDVELFEYGSNTKDSPKRPKMLETGMPSR